MAKGQYLQTQSHCAGEPRFWDVKVLGPHQTPYKSPLFYDTPLKLG